MDFQKQYKEVSPTSTVCRIRQLLKDAGINVKVKTSSLKKLVYSVRITVLNGRIADLDIGSNGKGLTPEYALASAYAELMERLQTRMLYDEMLMLPPSAIKKFMGASFFRCTPDEVLRKSEWSFFPKQGVLKERLRAGRTAHAEMFSLRSGKKEIVPLELMRYMTGSTGACAGNTKEEAIVQGICEILERHALQRVFLSQGKDMPTIPVETFGESPVLRRLNELAREQELKFMVKDCSFGMMMPILGLLVWNDTSYQFKLGVATSPEVALSRCFTEIYQGRTDNSCLLTKDQKLMVATSKNYLRAKINGTGHFPKSIFNKWREGKLDNFRAFEGTDVKGDYRVLTNMLLNAGYEIYILDCSFFVFPSYYVYIPGLSDIYPKLLDFQKRIDGFMSLSHKVRGTRYAPYNPVYLPQKYPHALYAFAVNLRKKDYTTALKCYESILGFQLPKTQYSEAIYKFVQLQSAGKRMSLVRAELKYLFGKQIADGVVAELGSSLKIVKTFKLPTCFNCTKCPTQSKCALCDLSKLDEVIRRKQCEYLKA